MGKGGRLDRVGTRQGMRGDEILYRCNSEVWFGKSVQIDFLYCIG